MVAVTNGLPYETPKDIAMADAFDAVNRDINGEPPRAA